MFDNDGREALRCFDVGGGAIANPLGDLAPGQMGGFDYDQGGFDDYGGDDFGDF